MLTGTSLRAGFRMIEKFNFKLKALKDFLGVFRVKFYLEFHPLPPPFQERRQLLLREGSFAYK